jgi:hypothetical protein
VALEAQCPYSPHSWHTRRPPPEGSVEWGVDEDGGGAMGALPEEDDGAPEEGRLPLYAAFAECDP